LLELNRPNKLTRQICVD